MIQANELRIGNKLYYRNLVDIVTVTELHKNTVRLKEIGDGKKLYQFYLFDPIPLTPEILEKAGFVIDKEVGLYEMRFLWQPHNNRTYFVYCDSRNSLQICKNGVYAIESPCQYLHQLQNLYYVLTGEELNIQL